MNDVSPRRSRRILLLAVLAAACYVTLGNQVTVLADDTCNDVCTCSTDCSTGCNNETNTCGNYGRCSGSQACDPCWDPGYQYIPYSQVLYTGYEKNNWYFYCEHWVDWQVYEYDSCGNYPNRWVCQPEEDAYMWGYGVDCCGPGFWCPGSPPSCA